MSATHWIVFIAPRILYCQGRERKYISILGISSFWLMITDSYDSTYFRQMCSLRLLSILQSQNKITFLNIVLVRCESRKQASRAFSMCSLRHNASLGAACMPHNNADISSSPDPLTISSLTTPKIKISDITSTLSIKEWDYKWQFFY